MFNPRLPGRLQVKLLLLAFIAGLPALALLFWFGLDDREHALGRAGEQLAGVARLASLDQERRMEGVRHTVKLLSRVPELRGASAKTCSSLLNELRDRQSGFYNLGVFNADGTLRCSAMPLPVAASVADQAWFRRAVDTRQLTISGYILSRLSGRHTLQFAAPLYDLSDQLNGVVFASWELTSHEKSLADLKLDAGTRLILADPDGIVLGSYPANPAAIGLPVADNRVLGAIRAGNAGGPGAVDDGPSPVLSRIGVVTVGGTAAMYAIASLDRAAVVTPIDLRAYRNFAVWLTTLAMMMAVAWQLGGRWVARRAATVSVVAQKIGEGIRGARTAFTDGPDELDHIGFAIDHMAESLERREQELLVSNRRLSEAQRIARLGHWQFDVQSHRTSWSPEASALLSIDTAGDSFDAFLQWVHPDDRIRVAAAFARSEAAVTPLDIEYRTVGIDGRQRWIHALAECVLNGEGRLLKLGGIIQDISERKSTVAALVASEDRYHQLFNDNPLPLWVYDPDTLHFLDVNDVACERYGYSREEFLAMTMRDIRPPEQVAGLEQRLPKDGETVLGSGPWQHRRRDGSVFMVETNNHEVLMHGRPARLVCPIDVTEKVYAQEGIRRMNLLLERKVEVRTDELARSLALQQSIFDSVPQIVWLADLAGGLTFANRIWTEDIGTAANDWQGDGWRKALHPEDLERVMWAWHQATTSGDFFDIAYRLLHRDGKYHDYQVDARKVFAPTGGAICWVGICSDVTDSRRREDALRFANQELEAYSYSVSHDLRAPLRTIDGFSERLQVESGARLDEQGRHYLERIRAGVANMNELIDDLLSLSQVTRGDMAMGRVDLTALARQVAGDLRQLEPDRAIEIVIGEDMSAHGDARLLRAVFVNLIGNALKFSARRAVSRIEIGETVGADATPVFFVRDNGAGFDPAYAAKMFGVFQRLHSVAEFPGTGIGLATVQRIVHRHGGSVSAEGAVDGGATIYFSLRRD